MDTPRNLRRHGQYDQVEAAPEGSYSDTMADQSSLPRSMRRRGQYDQVDAGSEGSDFETMFHRSLTAFSHPTIVFDNLSELESLSSLPRSVYQRGHDQVEAASEGPYFNRMGPRDVKVQLQEHQNKLDEHRQHLLAVNNFMQEPNHVPNIAARVAALEMEKRTLLGQINAQATVVVMTVVVTVAIAALGISLYALAHSSYHSHGALGSVSQPPVPLIFNTAQATQEKLDRLEAQVESLRDDNTRLQKQADAASTATNTINTTASQATRDVNSIRTEVVSLKAALHADIDTLTTITQKNVTSASADIAAFHTELASLADTTAAAIAEGDILAAHITVINKLARPVVANITSLSRQVAALAAPTTALQASIASLSDAVDTLWQRSGLPAWEQEPEDDTCSVAGWSSWSVCTELCDGGSQQRTRTLAPGAADGCSPAESRSCNQHPCLRNCTVTEWGAWSTCSTGCDEGQQWRRRSVGQPARGDGDPCPNLMEQNICIDAPCDVGSCRGCLTRIGQGQVLDP
eukprot:m.85746 g.85746  ORF g.85746 m.85746 type:complete len:519 (+) comp14851_c0_seq1:240-1796(+)